MAVGWFVVPIETDTRRPRTPGTPPSRYVTMDDYTGQIAAAGGRWHAVETLGSKAVVKVAGIPEAGLQDLAAIAGFKRLPKNLLNDSLADLPPAVKQALRDEMLGMGYTLQELQDRFGSDLGAYTLRDVLRFMVKRRREPSWNRVVDEIELSGPPVLQDPAEIDALDTQVSE